MWVICATMCTCVSLAVGISAPFHVNGFALCMHHHRHRQSSSYCFSLFNSQIPQPLSKHASSSVLILQGPFCECSRAGPGPLWTISCHSLVGKQSPSRGKGIGRALHRAAWAHRGPGQHLQGCTVTLHSATVQNRSWQAEVSHVLSLGAYQMPSRRTNTHKMRDAFWFQGKHCNLVTFPGFSPPREAMWALPGWRSGLGLDKRLKYMMYMAGSEHVLSWLPPSGFLPIASSSLSALQRSLYDKRDLDLILGETTKADLAGPGWAGRDAAVQACLPGQGQGPDWLQVRDPGSQTGRNACLPGASPYQSP